MSFLQPMLLAALPLVGLPILIHLMNQWRYRTVRWGAMMFLVAANRMSRGYARLRQWLILAFRMLAIAALIFAVSRPLAGGWLGLAAGGRPDTTIVLLDRSPSMEQGGAGGGGSKRQTGLQQLARALETLGSSRWVLIESGSNRPHPIESAGALAHAPGTGPTSAAADLPAMLLAARDHIRMSKAGRTEVWICSDLRANDWDPESARWQALREAFLEFPQGVRFHLLAYPQPAPGNLAVRVTDVRRRRGPEGAEVLVSLMLTREQAAGAGEEGKQSAPIQFEVDGARSELTVEMAGPQYQLKDHRIPLGQGQGQIPGQARGWGRVSIPADANPADDDFYFAHDEPAPRRALIVTEDPASSGPLELAAAIPPEATVQCAAEVLAPEQLAAADRDAIALVLWHAPLPTGAAAKWIGGFLERGGVALFLPPRAPGEAGFLGTRWNSWMAAKADAAMTVESWRGDEDLLAQTQGGAPLPVGTLQVRRWCAPTGDLTPLAVLRGGASLLARATTRRGGAYFLATTPAAADSSLASDGVVLYVLVQRALAAGAKVLASTRSVDAGVPPGDLTTPWRRIAGDPEALSTESPLHRGVYAARDRWLAVNRPAAEDAAAILSDRRVAELFGGLDYDRIDERAGSTGTLIQETWRGFLLAMMAAMLVEAGLCLPKARPAGGGRP